MTQIRAWLIDRGGLLALVIAAAYLWLAPGHIVDGDNAELAALGATGGVAHPSGYPLYVLWLRALSWLPGSPAHAAALATVVLAVAQVLALHAACRAWGARAAAATIACAIYASAPFVMRYGCEAEVFALSGLIVGSVLWLAADAGPLRGGWRALALGAIAGLGMANHLTCALVAPVGVVGAITAAREASWPRAIAGVLGGLVLGLVPYAYVFVAPETMASWPTSHGLDDLLDLVLRRAYGGPGAFQSGGGAIPYAANLGALAGTLGRSLAYVGALAGVALLGVRIARPAGARRRLWIALAASWLVAGPLLVLRFNVGDGDMALYVVRRFHLLAIELLVIPLAAALDLGLAHLPRLTAPRATVIGVLAFCALGARSLSYLAAVQSPALEIGARNLLTSLPPRAVVIADATELLMPVEYLQLAEGLRPDVLYVHWPFVGVSWYRARLADWAHLPIDTAGEGPPSLRIAEQIMGQGRPLFVDDKQGNILRAFPSYPFGVVIRVLPRGTAPPTLDEVVETNRALFQSFDFDYPRPGVHDEFATDAQRRYQQTWQQLAGALRAAHRPDEAADADRTARMVGPE